MWWLVGLGGVAVGGGGVGQFRWGEAGGALVGVNGWLLLAALVVNLVSPVAKAWGWHVLLGAVAPNRWWVAQEANLVGTAVNIVGVGVSGEAARVSLLVRRDHVPVRAAVLSVVGARVVEALGLGLFVVLAPLALDLPPALRGLQMGGGALLLTIVVMARFRVRCRLVARVPRCPLSTPMELAQLRWGR